jgi:hypothetical protein
MFLFFGRARYVQGHTVLVLESFGLALVMAILAPLSAPGQDGIVPISPPEQGFFSKKIVCQGIPIKAHREVDDRALLEARRRLAEMLASIPEIVHNLVEVGAELHIIGKNQNTSDLPSERHWKGRPFETHGKRALTIDERTRGVGGLPASCGEENLLKLPSDRYRDHRDICRHEFAHTVFDYGLSSDVRAMVEKQYAASMQKGLWKTAYASTNANEFFAELTMWYFGSRGDYGRIEPRPQEGRDWLRKYDPDGFAVLDAIYSGKQKVRRIVWEPLSLHPAKEEAELRPSSLVRPTTVLFDNRTSVDVSLFWIDPRGERKPYGVVHAGRKQVRPTFTTHAWVVVKPDGTVLGIYVAGSRPGKVVLE